MARFLLYCTNMKILFLLLGQLILIFPLGLKAQAQDLFSSLLMNPLPQLHQLEPAALNHAGMNPEQIERWQRGAKWSAALPQLQVGWESRSVNQNTTIIQDSLSVTSSGITVGPESNRADVDLSNNRDFEVKAVWALNELMFNRDQLYISREARDLYLVRTRLIGQLHDDYYKLKSLLLAVQMDPSRGQEGGWRLQVERKVNQLDSLTGGEFRRLLTQNNPKGVLP